VTARTVIYPQADIKRQWYGDKFATTDMGGVEKVLLHTTEGAGWPAYSSGATAPNLTYWPAQRQWRQHFPLNRSSRALCDSTATAVRENRDRVVQVEIIAICDPKLAPRVKTGTYVEDITAEAIADLGAFLAFMHTNYRVPLVAAPKWLPYPKSAGNSPVRMSGRQYDVFKGVLGHQHASGNAHGDPGRLDIPGIIHAAARLAAKATASVPAPPMPALPTALTVRSKEVLYVADTGPFRLLKTPDNRYWGLAGLQCTHLETPEILKEYLTVVGLTLADVKPASYEFIGQLQRIT
jgi:hypothetical protein